MFTKFTITAVALVATAFSSTAQASHINLGGPATGYLALSNGKNDSTQNGIEGNDATGVYNPSHNGLPDFPNFQIPPGYDAPQLDGLYTAINVVPQSTTADYATDFSNAFYGGTPLTVNNQTITDSDASTMSAGRIDYDNNLVPEIGIVTIPANQLTFNFDTYEWDGNINGDGGAFGEPTPGRQADNPWVVPGGTRMISPFSPVYTSYNDSNGAGNSAFFYNVSLSNVTGTGLTFEDGQLVSMDISADLTVAGRNGVLPTFPATNFTGGTFTASGLSYQFDLVDTRSVAVFSGLHMIFNRAGTASVVPEPSSVVLLGLATLVCGGIARWRK